MSSPRSSPSPGLVTTLFFGGWQVPYLLRDGFHFPWGGTWLLPHLGGGAAAGGGFYGQSGFFLLAADSSALERAALSLRSSHALGLEDAFAAGAAQRRRDGDLIIVAVQ